MNSPSGGDGAASAARVERNRDRRPPFRLGAAWRVRTRCPKHMLSAFGEPEIKSFVQASIDENLKLESSLHMLKTGRTVVVLHCAPVEHTVAGEPPEIFPFLGSVNRDLGVEFALIEV